MTKKSTSLAGCLVILLLGAVASQRACAGQDEQATHLTPVHVDASTIRQPVLARLPGTIVLSRASIDASPATTLAGLLASVPGINVRRRGAPGVQADIGVRGGNFKQTLILVDGVPFQSAQAGHLNSDVPVPLDAIQRIVIVRGAGAVGYADAGTGGVINIITRKGDEGSALRAGLSGGSHGSRAAHISVAGGSAQFANRLTAAAGRSDSTSARRPDASDARNLLYTGSARLGTARLAWGAAAARKDFDAWGFYSDVFPNAHEQTRSRMGWLAGRVHQQRWTLTGRAWAEGQHDDFLTVIGDEGFRNQHRTHSRGVRLTARHADGHGSSSAGASWRHARIRSNALGRHVRTHASLWLARHQRLGADMALDLGVKRALYPHSDKHWLPSARLTWLAAPHWKTHLAWARRARLPTYTELYLDTAANQGNATLGPELSTAISWGLKHTRATRSLQLTVYQRRTRHFIDFIRAPDETAFHAENLRELRVQGVDADWTWRPGWRCLERVTLGYSRLRHRLDSQAAKNSTRLPRQTLYAGARVALRPHLRLTLHARRPSYRQQATATLLDTRLGWQHAQLEVFLAARNLLDRRIVEAGFAPLPGRWWTLGVHIAL